MIQTRIENSKLFFCFRYKSVVDRGDPSRRKKYNLKIYIDFFDPNNYKPTFRAINFTNLMRVTLNSIHSCKFQKNSIELIG